jgi:hypothetical protein
MPPILTIRTCTVTPSFKKYSSIKQLIATVCSYSIVMLCLCCSTALAGSALAPSNTKIIDNFSQLGIDQLQPRFAWILHDKERGQMRRTLSGTAVNRCRIGSMGLLTAESRCAQLPDTGGKSGHGIQTMKCLPGALRLVL